LSHPPLFREREGDRGGELPLDILILKEKLIQLFISTHIDEDFSKQRSQLHHSWLLHISISLPN